jgi:hypothetical protein
MFICEALAYHNSVGTQTEKGVISLEYDGAADLLLKYFTYINS